VLRLVGFDKEVGALCAFFVPCTVRRSGVEDRRLLYGERVGDVMRKKERGEVK